ncbi:MAG: hypothetical protein GY703_06180 [Gammaproteobacteria bacterium]|nr:hypothetical protein [Gammaproteobacteria bacterium]
MNKRFSMMAPVILAAAVSTGCGVRFMYRQLDWMIPWYVYDYVNLDSNQRGLLEQRLLDQLDWHCDTQLPAYSEWLNEIAADPAAALSRPALDKHYRQVIRYWRVLIGRLVPDISALLATASDTQIEELMANLEARNQESYQRKVTAQPEERSKRRINRMEKQLSRWTGTLSEQQKLQIRQWNTDLEQLGFQWVETRRRWQNELRKALENPRNETTPEPEIRNLLVNPDSLWTEDFRRAIARNEERTLQMISDLSLTLDKDQLQHLEAELNNWIGDFQALSCKQNSLELGIEATETAE